ncbi:hypothetical protein AURDEDRAFT_79489 [Auricularia subglabra TFB-10046 SS5]|nr:hypothetical protein AURDEDRAFT_79489 [Auricularia subglabra TFB-10046 SS5]
MGSFVPSELFEPYQSVKVLSAHHRAVVVVTASAAGLSGFLVFILLLHILVLGLHPYFSRGSKFSDDGERAFLWRPIGALITSLFFSNLLQAISGMFETRWAHYMEVRAGAMCTTQAVLLLAGDVGVAVFNLLVAAHTFSTVALHQTWSSLSLCICIALGWAVMAITALLGPYALRTHERGPFYGISHSWCFISNNYAGPRIYLHYIPILVSAAAITLLYVLVALTVRGRLGLYNWRRADGWRHVFTSWRAEAQQLPSASLAGTANKMLWYPAAYLVIILPVTTARLCAQRGQHVPDWVWDLAIIVLHLTGTVNVIIYTTTRRALSPIEWARRGSAASTAWLTGRRGSDNPSLSGTGKMESSFQVRCRWTAPSPVMVQARLPDLSPIEETPHPDFSPKGSSGSIQAYP